MEGKYSLANFCFWVLMFF